jgi:predicted Zn-dependent protease
VRRLVQLSLAAALLAACGGSKAPPRAAIPPPPPPDPAALVAEARDLRAGGDLAGARDRLEAALLASPHSDDVMLELADLLVSDGQEVHRAKILLEGVGAREGARWFLLSARVAEILADDLRAEAAYARALAAEDDPDARLRRVLALERLGRIEEATEELERVRTSRPRDALLRTRIGERYEAAGRLAEAESELRVAAEAQPERAQGWERLARFYERAGRLPEARAALDRAREAGARGGRALRPLLPSRR